MSLIILNTVQSTQSQHIRPSLLSEHSVQTNAGYSEALLQPPYLKDLQDLAPEKKKFITKLKYAKDMEMTETKTFTLNCE